MGNVRLLFERLLDGQAWSAVFVPSGGRVLAWLALPALAALSVIRREYFRGTIVLLLALGMLIPATYDSFLWNRLRYLWPFAPGWVFGARSAGTTPRSSSRTPGAPTRKSRNRRYGHHRWQLRGPVVMDDGGSCRQL